MYEKWINTITLIYYSDISVIYSGGENEQAVILGSSNSNSKPAHRCKHEEDAPVLLLSWKFKEIQNVGEYYTKVLQMCSTILNGCIMA